MQKYDFDQFLVHMSGLEPNEIIREAEREATRVEDSTRKVPGAVQARADGARAYVDKIGSFLYYMRFGERPYGAKEEDFQKYKEGFR